MRNVLLVVVVTLSMSAGAAVARDECRDVLINKVMDMTDLKRTREVDLAILARMATVNTDQQNVETSAKFPIEGVPVEGQGDWARSQKDQMNKSLDLSLAVRESGSLLMFSGQDNIIKAWRDCMLEKGGGHGSYFVPIGDGSSQVYFHIQYLQDPLKEGKEQVPLTLASSVYLDPSIQAVSNADCLQAGFTIIPGEECTVQLVVPSAWTTVPIVMSFRTPDGIRAPLDDVLLPRVTPTVDYKNVSFSIAEIYSVGGVAASPVTCSESPPGYSFAGEPQVLTTAKGAAATANSCTHVSSMNATSTRFCVTGSISNTPRSPADYYCSWQIEGVAAGVVMFPPKP